MIRLCLLGLAASLFLGLLSCTSTQSLGTFRIDPSMLQLVSNRPYGEQEWSGTVVIGNGRVEQAKVEVSSKGNGALEICGQSFRVYDGHDDLNLFEPYCLHITFVDLDGDGYRDLVLEGVRLEQDDDDAPTRRVPILQIFRYDVEEGRFDLMPALKEGASRAPSLLLD